MFSFDDVEFWVELVELTSSSKPRPSRHFRPCVATIISSKRRYFLINRPNSSMCLSCELDTKVSHHWKNTTKILGKHTEITYKTMTSAKASTIQLYSSQIFTDIFACERSWYNWKTKKMNENASKMVVHLYKKIQAWIFCYFEINENEKQIFTFSVLVVIKDSTTFFNFSTSESETKEILVILIVQCSSFFFFSHACSIHLGNFHIKRLVQIPPNL